MVKASFWERRCGGLDLPTGTLHGWLVSPAWEDDYRCGPTSPKYAAPSTLRALALAS